MSTPGGVTFIAGKFNRKDMTCCMSVAEQTPYDRTHSADELKDELRKRWSNPFRLRIEAVTLPAQGLPEAPDFKTQRRHAYRPDRRR
eukprot:3462955-Prorocentrum_lima.AAC.1